ncbi:MAG: hypothetical protein KF901_10285 [Myxococcales bacterium]|nr:hypothetical protein [Myxococcales bacterium]
MPLRHARICLIASVALLFGGCHRVHTLQRQASKLERYVTITGEIQLPTRALRSVEDGATIVVQLLRPGRAPDAPGEVVARAVLFAPGSFQFTVPPARYAVVGFVDEDGGLGLDADEWRSPATPWRDEPVELQIEEPTRTPWRQSVLRRPYELGTIADLDDPRFGADSGAFGIFQPLRWSRRFPMGIFFTEPWDPDRVPVLFVYGMGGHPQQLRPWMEQLDRSRYQAWFVHYPTGLPLELVAEWLSRGLDELYARHDFEGLCVVAHSMGGLIARATLGRHEDDSYLRGLTTVATPFGGVPSAAFGVWWSPATAPAWHDVSPESAFLSRLFERSGPRQAQRDLVFLFQPGRTSDGVVHLSSQMRDEAQAESQRVAGFPLGHAEVLESREVWRFVEEGLARCAVPRAPVAASSLPSAAASSTTSAPPH